MLIEALAAGVVGAVLLWLVLRGQNVGLIREKIAHARWGWAALALALAEAM